MPEPGSLVMALAEARMRGVSGAAMSGGRGPARKVWVRAGDAVFVDSADPKERYTEILSRHGRLTRTEILLIEGEYAGAEMTEEQAIRAADMIPADELPDYGRKVFEERLLGAFGLVGATWTFVEGSLPPGTPEYPMAIAVAIQRGIRERYTPDRLKEDFPVGANDHYAYVAIAAERLGVKLSKIELALARALDGDRSWNDAVSSSKLSAKDAHATLFAMAALGMVSHSGETPAPPKDTGAGLARAQGAVGAASEMRTLALRELPDVLSLPVEASVASTQSAFKALIGRYELGRAHQLGEADREAALSLLDRATDAYLVMTHPQSRTKYFESAPWDRETIAAGLALDLAPEKHYLKAGIFLQAGNYLAAEAALLPALQLQPRDPRFHLRMGIAIYQRAKQRGSPVPSGAARALEKAAAFDPKGFEPWLFLGHIALSNSDLPRARLLYEHALDLEPKADEAKRAIAALKSITS